jgi:hypothetical protein
MLKTGSTSIQQALFSDSANPGFSYFQLGTPFIDRKIKKAFCSPPHRLAPDLQGTTDSKRRILRESMRHAIAEADIRPLILSSESLSLFTEEELKDLIDFLRSQSLDLQAVAYVRDFESWSESVFQQSCRYGTWKPSLFPLGHGAYRFAIEKFDRLLGVENVALWKYDRKLFPDGCVVRDFYRRCGLGEYRGTPPELNEAMGLDAAKLLLAYHRSGLGEVCDERSFDANIQLASHIQKLHGPSIRFHDDLISERMVLESADLDWMENRLGHGLRARHPVDNPADSIRSEEDLNNLTDRALDWLSSASDCRISTRNSPAELSHSVARAMTALRDKLIARNPSSGKTLHSPSILPKIIWIFWEQGFSQAPPIVETCIESWREKNPGWDLRLLDGRSAEPHLRKASIPWRRLQALPREKRANILRMRLLTEEGGVWTDAATFCLQPLDEWLPECMRGGFFVFRDSNHYLMADNWFIASDRESPLAKLWRDSHEKFWAERDYYHHSCYPGEPAPGLPLFKSALLQLLHLLFDRNTRSTDWWFHPVVRVLLRSYPYCVMHYIFNREFHRNADFRGFVNSIPYRDAKPSLRHYLAEGYKLTLDELIQDGLDNNIPLLKLKWEFLQSPTGGSI